MRVLHVIPTLDPAAGGPPVVVSRLAAAQAQLGHSVKIVSYGSPDAVQRTADSIDQVPGFSRVQSDSLVAGGPFERLLATNARRSIEKIIETIDVLHLHGIWNPILQKAATVAVSFGRPYVVSPHGMLDPWSMSQRRMKKKVALALGYRRMLDRAAFLHALNADEAELILPLKLRCRLTVIPNGVFLEELFPLPKRGTFYALHPDLCGAPFILFLSRLHFKKGLDYLIDAFARVARERADVHLVIAGPDGGAQKTAEAQADILGIRSRVHFVGGLYGEQKISALVDSTCFCLPSRQEGFSIAITESLACGVPVVISAACHFPEVKEVGAGRVVELDPQSIAGALLEIVTDPALRETMGRAGREMISSRFTWPHIAELMLEQYRIALAGASTE